RGSLLLSFTVFVLLLLAAGCFVAYVLWPTWPSGPTEAHRPDLPVTIAGALFEVPPMAIRTAIQRRAGPHERIDLAFLWPSLQPTPPGSLADSKPLHTIDGSKSAALTGNTPVADADGRLFVTIAALGSLLPPAERLRYVYPRYVEDEASAGADGLAVLPFRAGTPYDGQDLIYFAEKPNRFFTLCTRDTTILTGMCIYERVVGAADVTLRFPRDWLKDWRGVFGGLSRLIVQLHPPQN
ncbi:MAG: hypothetical protein ACRECE_09445, partial [Xanthobacteraceae bacterium]